MDEPTLRPSTQGWFSLMGAVLQGEESCSQRCLPAVLLQAHSCPGSLWQWAASCPRANISAEPGWWPQVVVGVWSSRKMPIPVAFLPVREPDSKAAYVGLHPTEGSSSTIFGKRPSTPWCKVFNVFFPLLLHHWSYNGDEKLSLCSLNTKP